MSKDILYYPTIEFQRNDYYWLWASSLIWDRIYRIVPDGYKLNEARNIEELCSTGEIGIPISPTRYGQEIKDEFLDIIHCNKNSAAALDFHIDDIEEYEKYTMVHQDKVDVSLRNFLLLDEDDVNDEWLYVPKEMANMYMTYLANHIATQNNLALNTHDDTIWTSSIYFHNDENLQDALYAGDDYIEPSRDMLASLLLNDLIPTNLMSIPPDKLLKFRSKRKDERVNFLNAIENYTDKLSEVNDKRILNELIHEESKNIEKAMNEYKRSMDIINAVKWSGRLSSFTALAIDATGYLDIGTQVLQNITTGGVGVGIITGMIERVSEPSKSPYSYLMGLSRLGVNEFEKYNYSLNRKIEEFIND